MDTFQHCDTLQGNYVGLGQYLKKYLLNSERVDKSFYYLLMFKDSSITTDDGRKPKITLKYSPKDPGFKAAENLNNLLLSMM